MNARILIVGCVLLSACAASKATHAPRPLPPGAQAFSMQGEALYPPPLDTAERTKREAQLLEAKAAYDLHPDDAQALIWYGRRLGYLSRFQEAIAVFTDGIAKHPEDPWMWRFRGHRYISVRDFDRALPDLERAAQLVANRADEPEPAGMPNARGVDIDTLKQNVFYHLGLAHYLRGDFEGALPAWRECLRVSNNPDSLCSATYWLYMTLCRAGRAKEAAPLLDPIRANLDVIEYHGYHRILLAYKGIIDPDELLAKTPATGKTAVDHATIGYGIGNWHFFNGRRERAREIFQEIAQAEQWPAFGRIASEVELARSAQPSR